MAKKERSLQNLEDYRTRNAELPCSLPGCTEPRYGGYPYCIRHANQQRYYGEPNAIPPPNFHQLEGFISKATRYWAANALHPAVQKAKALFDGFLRTAKGPLHRGLPGWSVFSKLENRQVDRVFALWLALAIYYKFFPNQLASPRALAFSLARYLIRYVHMSVISIPMPSYRGLAMLLFRSFYVLLDKMAEAYLRAEKGGLEEYEFDPMQEGGEELTSSKA